LSSSASRNVGIFDVTLMALKVIYQKFPSPISNGIVYVNSSNAFILILNMAVVVTGAGGAVSVQDQYGVSICDLVRIVGISESLSVSGSDTFSTTASTSTGITSTTESLNESISGLNFLFNVVVRKGLVLPNWQVACNAQVQVVGFIAIQADSLEELRGFL
jgi:hypothetical protein